jgi:multiple sugar transport system permease protein
MRLYGAGFMTAIKRKRNWFTERRLFYIFISPWLLGFILLTAGPMVYSMFLSFTSWDLATPIKWVRAQNYLNIFSKDPDFWQSIKITFLWTAFLPIGIIFALFLANQLNKKIHAMRLFRTVIYIPTIVPAVANCLLWLWIFNPEAGMLNMVLGWFGLPKTAWLLSTKTALVSLIIMSLWQVGGNVVIFLAALQGVPKDVMEAADIDGVSNFKKYFNIILPLIGPALFFQLVMGIIGALQVFTPAYLMTSGGPQKATFFYIYYLYNVAFVRYNMGYASALAWILFIIILALTLLVFKLIGRKIYYEDA